jgi:hypothetical protein
LILIKHPTVVNISLGLESMFSVRRGNLKKLKNLKKLLVPPHFVTSKEYKIQLKHFLASTKL